MCYYYVFKVLCTFLFFHIDIRAIISCYSNIKQFFFCSLLLFCRDVSLLLRVSDIYKESQKYCPTLSISENPSEFWKTVKHVSSEFEGYCIWLNNLGQEKIGCPGSFNFKFFNMQSDFCIIFGFFGNIYLTICNVKSLVQIVYK